MTNLPALILAYTEPLYKLLRTGGPHARAVALHARRFTATIRTLRTATLRTPTLRTPNFRLRPPRDPHRRAKPPLHRFAATTVKALHIQETMCALQRLRAAGAFVFLRHSACVGVAGKIIAPQLPPAVAQRAAPSFPIAVGMQTLAPARAMPFRSQGMTSTAALRPLMFRLLLGPRVTPLVLGAVARDQRACRRGSSA